jgi:osmotically-inducible protein OsmY
MATNVRLQDLVAPDPERKTPVNAAQIASRDPVAETADDLSGSGKRGDVKIARSARLVLRWATFLPKDAVKVTVTDGWVTLSGEVEREYQRQPAVRAVSLLPGVLGVSDQINVKAKEHLGVETSPR